MPVVVGSLLSGMFFVALAVLLYRAQPLLINVQPAYTTIAAVADRDRRRARDLAGGVERSGAARRW